MLEASKLGFARRLEYLKWISVYDARNTSNNIIPKGINLMHVRMFRPQSCKVWYFPDRLKDHFPNKSDLGYFLS